MDTITIFLVDDENLTLQLIQKCIDWKSFGMEITGAFLSAQEALRAMACQCPDAVFSDINMPKINGIEFGRMVREQYPQVHFLLLTGYEDFTYVQQSIRLGATDYLLKPIDPGELCVTAGRLRERIQEERRLRQEREELQYGAFCGRGCWGPENGRDKKYSALITDVVEQIRKNYGDYELSLKSLAEKFDRNASYLSRVFKQETGKSLIEYITFVRMEAARRLLWETELKLYEIAEQIGILDANYFAICFRKHYDMTPSQYRSEQKHYNFL